PLHAHPAIQRTGALALLPVGLRESPLRETLADLALLERMDVGGIPDVHGHGHAGVRHREREPLRVTEERRLAAVARVAEGRDLHEVEREVAVSEGRAPVADERREERAVLARALAVRLALVPDRAADRVRDERRDHAVPEHARRLRIEDLARRR